MKLLSERRLIQRVSALLTRARQRWPRTPELSRLVFRFPHSGMAVGKVIFRANGKITFQITREAMSRWPRETLEETLPHEVAHLVCFAEFPRARAHGRQWQLVCRALGGSARSTHEHITTPARRCRRYLYRTACGKQVWLGPVRHRRAQTGTTYHYRGQPLSYAHRQQRD